jgi:FAD:protein FMN transferase
VLTWIAAAGPYLPSVELRQNPEPRAPAFAKASAGWPSASYEYSQVHMGLPVRLVLHGVDEPAAADAARAAFARIAALDRMMSDYRPDSELRRLEQRTGQLVRVSPELFTVLTRAVQIAGATGGAFDPTIGPLVSLWRESRRSGRLPDAAALAVARSRVGWQHIDLDEARSSMRLALPGMRLDLGGIAKGYILQEALLSLRAHGVTRALAEGGGDIVVGDAPPGRAGWTIETVGADPAFTERALRLTNSALASSGSTAQFVEIDGVRYSHVVDPRTGLAVTSNRLARVIAADAATADALATALTVLDGSAIVALRNRFPEVSISLTGAGVAGSRGVDAAVPASAKD